jgi:hypothetical protein
MIVIAHKTGQLGNRLFLFGHMIAAAIEARTTVLYPGFADYAHLFDRPSRGLFPSYPDRQRSHWPDAANQVAYWVGLNALRLAKRRMLPGVPWFETKWNVDKMVDIGKDDFLSLASGRIVLCGGFFYRSERLLQKHADLVREYFRPAPQWLDRLSQLTKQIRSGADHVVGVHVRRTDNSHFKGGIYWYGPDVYLAYMHRMRRLLPGRCRFMVTSDEPIDVSTYDGFDVVTAPGNILLDLHALCSCDFIVGPPSTYSGWASFSAQKPVHFIPTAKVADAEKLQLTDFALDWSGWT